MVERLEPKRQLMQRVETIAHPAANLSSNTAAFRLHDWTMSAPAWTNSTRCSWFSVCAEARGGRATRPDAGQRAGVLFACRPGHGAEGTAVDGSPGKPIQLRRGRKPVLHESGGP